MKHRKLVCLSILIICIACNQNSSNIPEISKVESQLLSKYFNQTEIKSLANILSAFTQGICKDLSSDEITRCYEIHFQSLKSDYFQNNPVHLNFPYGEGMSLDQYRNEAILASIWNDICLMGNKDLDIRIEYFCLNPIGPFVDYFKSWSSTTNIYQHLIARIENETLSINYPNELFLVPNEFDFSRSDDQIIYTILHITLAEEYKALKSAK